MVSNKLKIQGLENQNLWQRQNFFMFTLKYKFEPFMHINECYDNITEIMNMLY